MGCPGATFCTSAIICATAGFVAALSVGAVCTITNDPTDGATRFGPYSSWLVRTPKTKPAARSACCRPSTFEMFPTTKMDSGAFPALLVRIALATAAKSAVAGTASALSPYTTSSLALFAPAVSDANWYWPDGVFSVTIAAVRPDRPNTFVTRVPHALLATSLGIRQPVKPKPYSLPQKFDDSAHPKYGTFCCTRYFAAPRSGVIVGTTANTWSCWTSLVAPWMPRLGSPPSSVRPR